ncbi:DMT family transporter [Tenacibaculum sp. M341]|uniref:DMT family transporter n=1 Tax=Tenacibaculum sp. M341 TaxID=2530339 RepID=UPI002110800D|nr:DMT family transporter [Tenacibaculum sp. M341]
MYKFKKNNSTILKKAIYYMLLSALSFTFLNVFIKYLSDFSTYQKVFFRGLGSLFFTMCYLMYHKIPMLGNKKKLLITRGVLGVTSMSLFFAATNHLTIGTAVSLRYTAPIFAAILAVVFLKEKIYKLQWVFFLVAMLGVFLIKGFAAEINTIGLILVMSSAFFSGLVYVIITKIGTNDHPVVIINYFMWISVLIGGVLSINNWKVPQGNEWTLLFSLGIFGYFGQLFMTKAYQLGTVNKIVPLKYVEVIFTMILGVLWFGDVYPVLSLLGVLMVIVALVLNVFYKKKAKI